MAATPKKPTPAAKPPKLPPANKPLSKLTPSEMQALRYYAERPLPKGYVDGAKKPAPAKGKPETIQSVTKNVSAVKKALDKAAAKKTAEKQDAARKRAGMQPATKAAPAPAKTAPKAASKPASSGFVGIKEADQARITERYMKAQEAKKTAAKQAAARKAAGMRVK
jgi:hypothetical protein